MVHAYCRISSYLQIMINKSINSMPAIQMPLTGQSAMGMSSCFGNDQTLFSAIGISAKMLCNQSYFEHSLKQIV